MSRCFGAEGEGARNRPRPAAVKNMMGGVGDGEEVGRCWPAKAWAEGGDGGVAAAEEEGDHGVGGFDVGGAMVCLRSLKGGGAKRSVITARGAPSGGRRGGRGGG